MEEHLPNPIGHVPLRLIPLPIALYESNGLIFELYEGGRAWQPQVIRWAKLKPIPEQSVDFDAPLEQTGDSRSNNG